MVTPLPDGNLLIISLKLIILPPTSIIFLAATIEIENEQIVILCYKFPVPKILPG